MSNDFFRKYDMQVYPSHRKMRRVPQGFLRANMWNVKISDDMLYQDSLFRVEEVDCVDITMPKDRLQELEDMIAWYEDKETRVKHHEEIVQKLRQDERVRIECPAVQAAYMKYLNLLELCRK